MWKYKLFAIIAALFMVGEVMMDLIQPELMHQIVDNGVLGLENDGVGNINLVWQLGIKMILLVLFGGFCGSMNNVFVNMSGQNIGNEIRKNCFQNIMTFSFPQIDKFGTGSLVTRVTNDITQVQNLISHFVRGMVRTLLLTFGSMYFMFQLDKTIGMIILCTFPFIIGCMGFCLWKANPLFSKLQSQLDVVNGIMQEDISGIRMIKACVREIYEKMRFGKANDELVKTQLQILIIFAFMNPVVNALIYVTIAVIFCVETTPGVVMAAITYTTQLLNGVLMLVMLFQSISRGYVSWKRVKEVLHTQPELKDGKVENTDCYGMVEFKNVSFCYTGSEKAVIENINLKIHSGETIAIMGATGCGKTSLINLIPRFYDAVSGTVFVDGVDVKQYNQKALRKKIAVVLQKSELFGVTIAENIAWGGKGDIKQAAKIAQADEFISSMTEGYNTVVSERGMNLSGGQKQRVSIARAILKSAEILIFDDATSELDLKTEAQLYDALQKYCPKSTKIIVAQRIASVQKADRIVVMAHGNIVAVGTHKELFENCQIYKDICHSQIGKEC